MRCQYIISAVVLAVLSLAGLGSAAATAHERNVTAETWKVLIQYWEQHAKATPTLFNITSTKPARANGTPVVTLTLTPKGPKNVSDAEKVVASCFKAHCLTPAQKTAFWQEMSKLNWGQTCKAGKTNLEFHYRNGTIITGTVGRNPHHVAKNCKKATIDIPEQTAANAAELQIVMDAFANPELTNTMIIFSFIDSNGASHLFPVNLQVSPRDKLPNSKRDTEVIAGTQNENLLIVPEVAPSRKFRPSIFGTPTATSAASTPAPSTSMERKPVNTPAPKLTVDERIRLESDYLKKCKAHHAIEVSRRCRKSLLSSIVKHRTANSSTATPTSVASPSVTSASESASTSTVEVKTLVTRNDSISTSTSTTAAPTKSDKPAVPWFCDPNRRAQVASLGLSSPADWGKKCAGYQLL